MTNLFDATRLPDDAIRLDEQGKDRGLVLIVVRATLSPYPED